MQHFEQIICPPIDMWAISVSFPSPYLYTAHCSHGRPRGVFGFYSEMFTARSRYKPFFGNRFGFVPFRAAS